MTGPPLAWCVLRSEVFGWWFRNWILRPEVFAVHLHFLAGSSVLAGGVYDQGRGAEYTTRAEDRGLAGDGGECNGPKGKKEGRGRFGGWWLSYPSKHSSAQRGEPLGARIMCNE